jgi:histidine triad (HIT) family protein
MTTSDCAFCDIATDRAPARMVDEWPDTLAFLPSGGGVTSGHTLVVPRGHVNNAVVDPVVSATTMARTAQLAGRMIADGQMPGANIITSIGRVATQSVFHLHVHIVPRHEGDGLHLPWTPSTELDSPSRKDVH